MGMYDREPNFEENFSEGDRFVITGMEYAGTINTRFGPAEKTLIQIVSREHPTVKRTYSAIGSGFAQLAKRADRGDFPHVAEFIRVKLDEKREVKRFAPIDVDPRAFIDGENGPPLSAEFHPDVLKAEPVGATGNGDDDSSIGF